VDPPPDGKARAKETPHERLVDDHHSLARKVILLGEVAAVQKWNP
jgi:hypothetical protein